MEKLAYSIMREIASEGYDTWVGILIQYPNITGVLKYLENCDSIDKRLAEIRIAISEDELTVEQVQTFAKPEYDWLQMYAIRNAYASGLSEDKIKLFSEPKFNGEQMLVLSEGLIKHPEFEWKLKLVFDERLPAENMKQIIKAIAEGLPTKRVEVLINPEFSKEQLQVVIDGLEMPLTIEQVQSYAAPMLTPEEMEAKKIALTRPTLIAFFETTEYEFSPYQVKVLESAVEQGVTLSQLNMFAKPEFSIDQLTQIFAGLNRGLSVFKVKYYAKHKYSAGRMEEIRIAFEKGLTCKQVKLLANPVYSREQMRQIAYGFESGLSYEQVAYYANPKFSSQQMTQIIFGWRNGLTEKQISVFANLENKYDSAQMEVIRNGLQARLSMKDIKIYAKPEFSANQMREILKGILEDLPRDHIKSYADPKLHYSVMRNERLKYTEQKRIAFLEKIFSTM